MKIKVLQWDRHNREWLLAKERKSPNSSKPHERNASIPRGTPILATNLETNEIFIIRDRFELKARGFNQGNVSSVCHGRKAQHKGHTFKYITIEEAKKYEKN